MRFEHEDEKSTKVIIEVPSAASIEDVSACFRLFLAGCGYAAKSIDKYFPEEPSEACEIAE